MERKLKYLTTLKPQNGNKFNICQQSVLLIQQQLHLWMVKVCMSRILKSFSSWIAQSNANGRKCHRHSPG